MKPHHWVAGGVALVAVLGLLASVIWLAGQLGRPEGEGQRTGTAAEADVTKTPTASQPAPTGTAFRSAVANCRSAWRSQDRALSTGAASLDQWRVHVDAMNKLVAGKITFAQASRFWKASKAGAAARVARFRTADQRVLHAALKCPPASHVDGSSVQRQAIAACRQGAMARGRVLASARTAVRTWRHHIHDMELLRAGKLSPHQALIMWEMNWRKGVAELRRYREARGAASGYRGC